MSPSEVHASVKRAQSAKLIHGPEFQNRPNLGALEEFLVHGLKSAFPAGRAEFTLGVATSYAAEPLRDVIGQGKEPIPVGHIQRAKSAASHSSPCTELRRAPLFATLHSTSTWL
jgi:hypothetical protein